MAQIPGNFNASSHEDMNDFSTIPEADYIASIVKSDIVLTKAAKKADDPSLGQMAKFQLKVMSGKYKGKILFTQLNIVNPSAATVEIAQKELATIARACGINGRVEDTSMLHGIPMNIKVGIETSANFPDKNVITMYSPASGTANIPVDDTDKVPANVAGDDSSDDDSAVPEKASKKKPWD